MVLSYTDGVYSTVALCEQKNKTAAWDLDPGAIMTTDCTVRFVVRLLILHAPWQAAS